MRLCDHEFCRQSPDSELVAQVPPVHVWPPPASGGCRLLWWLHDPFANVLGVDIALQQMGRNCREGQAKRKASCAQQVRQEVHGFSDLGFTTSLRALKHYGLKLTVSIFSNFPLLNPSQIAPKFYYYPPLAPKSLFVHPLDNSDLGYSLLATQQIFSLHNNTIPYLNPCFFTLFNPFG